MVRFASSGKEEEAGRRARSAGARATFFWAVAPHQQPMAPPARLWRPGRQPTATTPTRWQADALRAHEMRGEAGRRDRHWFMPRERIQTTQQWRWSDV